MKIDYQVDQSEHIGLEYQVMDIDHSKKAKMIALMTANLYKNPPEAIIRELCSNAYDANLMAGDASKPIWITIPTITDSYVKVKDEALGLSHDDAVKTLLTILGSEKDQSDEFIGGWGLGAKSPIAYASEYEVYVRKDGIQMEFHATKSPSGMIHHTLFEETKYDGPNGVEFKIPVKLADHYIWRRVISSYYCNTNYNVVITNPEHLIYSRRGKELYKFETKEGYSFSLTDHEGTNIFVRYGGFLYQVTTEGIEGDALNFIKKWSQASNRTLIINVPVGAISFVPSRDSMELSLKTINYLSNALASFSSYVRLAVSALSSDYIREAYNYATLVKDLVSPLLDVADRFFDPNSGTTHLLNLFNHIRIASFTNLVLDEPYELSFQTTGARFSLNLKEIVPGTKSSLLSSRITTIDFPSASSNSAFNTKRVVSYPLSRRGDLWVSMIRSVRDQIKVIWNPVRMVRKAHSIPNEPYTSQFAFCECVFNIIAETEEDAIELARLAGFPESVVSGIMSASEAGINVDSSKLVSKSKKSYQRSEIPTFVRCALTKARHPYCKSNLLVYITEEENVALLTTLKTLLDFRLINNTKPLIGKLLQAENLTIAHSSHYSIFVASNAFIKRSGDLPNVVHWKTLFSPTGNIFVDLEAVIPILTAILTFINNVDVRKIKTITLSSRPGTELKEVIPLLNFINCGSNDYDRKRTSTALRQIKWAIEYVGFRGDSLEKIKHILSYFGIIKSLVFVKPTKRGFSEAVELINKAMETANNSQSLELIRFDKASKLDPVKLNRILLAIEKEARYEFQ